MYIKKLAEEDRQALMTFLSYHKAYNLFAIGDVEIYGFDTSFMTVWALMDEEDEIKSTLLKYYESLIISTGEEDVDLEPFTTIIRTLEEKVQISGNAKAVNSMAKLMPTYNGKESYLCELLKPSPTMNDTDRSRVQVAVTEDGQRIYDFIQSIEEFSGFGDSPDKYCQKISDGSGRVYYIENEAGQIISVAQTAAECSAGAVIIGVATDSNYRKQGLMRQCMSALCKDLLDDDKVPVLFYSNPEAGRIYQDLGFEKVGNWKIIREE